MRRAYIIFLGLFLLMPRGADAQERGFAMGVVGLTFAENTSWLAGAKGGFSITSALQIVGIYERMNDVLTSQLATDLRAISRATNVRIEGKLPANYLAAGIRYNFASAANVHPYVQFDVGVAQTDPQLTLISEDGEDITDQIDVQLDETNGAIALSAGIRAEFGGSLSSEFGFKWVNIFTDPTLKINRLHFALGASF
jgi:hypothetical protein